MICGAAAHRGYHDLPRDFFEGFPSRFAPTFDTVLPNQLNSALGFTMPLRVFFSIATFAFLGSW